MKALGAEGVGNLGRDALALPAYLFPYLATGDFEGNDKAAIRLAVKEFGLAFVEVDAFKLVGMSAYVLSCHG